MNKEERQAILGLEEDNRWNPLAGRPLRLRLRNFRPAADSYLPSLGGPLPYMVRLREIDAQTTAHVAGLQMAWSELAEEETDATRFARLWRERAAGWSFDEVNDLIDRHNRWYPVESRLPMDPQTGDHALVNGEHYRRAPLDAGWALGLFPPDRAIASR